LKTGGLIEDPVEDCLPAEVSGAASPLRPGLKVADDSDEVGPWRGVRIAGGVTAGALPLRRASGRCLPTGGSAGFLTARWGEGGVTERASEDRLPAEVAGAASPLRPGLKAGDGSFSDEAGAWRGVLTADGASTVLEPERLLEEELDSIFLPRWRDSTLFFAASARLLASAELIPSHRRGDAIKPKTVTTINPSLRHVRHMTVTSCVDTPRCPTVRRCLPSNWAFAM